jgi:hypothetical protein
VPGYVVGPALPPNEFPFPLGWEGDGRVVDCVHPEWETVLVTHPEHFQECVRCVECHAPRCGKSTADDPCMRIRHHRGDHVLLSGRLVHL